jgi:hypothetical protein
MLLALDVCCRKLVGVSLGLRRTPPVRRLFPWAPLAAGTSTPGRIHYSIRLGALPSPWDGPDGCGRNCADNLVVTNILFLRSINMAPPATDADSDVETIVTSSLDVAPDTPTLNDVDALTDNREEEDRARSPQRRRLSGHQSNGPCAAALPSPPRRARVAPRPATPLAQRARRSSVARATSPSAGTPSRRRPGSPSLPALPTGPPPPYAASVSFQIPPAAPNVRWNPSADGTLRAAGISWLAPVAYALLRDFELPEFLEMAEAAWRMEALRDTITQYERNHSQ